MVKKIFSAVRSLFALKFINWAMTLDSDVVVHFALRLSQMHARQMMLAKGIERMEVQYDDDGNAYVSPVYMSGTQH